MTQGQLEAVMMFQIEAFSTMRAFVDRDTVHNTILSKTDGFGGSVSSASIYKSFVRFSIVQAGEKDRTWPTTWLTLSVADLATRLLGGQA
jgi:hypothetical protein